jgi:pilus assembly protein Flp/PilA
MWSLSLMTKLIVSQIRQLRSDRSGVTALEYGLIAAIVAVGILAALGTLGSSLSGIFVYIAGKL